MKKILLVSVVFLLPFYSYAEDVSKANDILQPIEKTDTSVQQLSQTQLQNNDLPAIEERDQISQPTVNLNTGTASCNEGYFANQNQFQSVERKYNNNTSCYYPATNVFPPDGNIDLHLDDDPYEDEVGDDSSDAPVSLSFTDEKNNKIKMDLIQNNTSLVSSVIMPPQQNMQSFQIPLNGINILDFCNEKISARERIIESQKEHISSLMAFINSLNIQMDFTKKQSENIRKLLEDKTLILEEKNQVLEKDNKALKEEIQVLKKDNNVLKEEYQRYQQDIMLLRKQIELQNNKERKFIEEIKSLEFSLDEREESIFMLNKEIQRLKDKIALIQGKREKNTILTRRSTDDIDISNGLFPFAFTQRKNRSVSNKR
ncbi:MAG: hypothetical protein IJ730_07765 [Alphaproteobacteria bacterium]|nr:hypothetical protein [Alphaproteobacteria bacterium]